MNQADEARARVDLVLEAAGRPSGPLWRYDDGCSGNLVVRIDAAEPTVAKIVDPARETAADELAHEVAALRWLAGRCGAPTLLWSGIVEGRPAMLTTALAGAPAHAAAGTTPEAALIAALDAIRALHLLAFDDCPLDQRLSVKLAAAKALVAAGAVDEGDFQPENRGRSAGDLLRELMATVPPKENLVVAHGDACLPNFIVDPAGHAGIVDLGRMGVADRHQDLALFVRSARHNFPEVDALGLVRGRYDLAPIDEEKLHFYKLLDELF